MNNERERWLLSLERDRNDAIEQVMKALHQLRGSGRQATIHIETSSRFERMAGAEGAVDLHTDGQQSSFHFEVPEGPPSVAA